MKRLAHLGAVVGSLLLGACGGRLGTEDVIAPPDTQVSGFHGYEGTITNVVITMDGGSGPSRVSPSEGRAFHMDLERSETVRAAFSTAFTDAVLAETGTTGTVTLSGDSLFAFTGGTSSGGASWETWKSVTISFDERGVPVSGTLTGELSVSEGDVVWMGKSTARVAFGADKVAPTFHATSSAGFASGALPWDDRRIEASEPFLNDVVPASFGLDASKWSATKLSQKGWVGDPSRGFLLRSKDWDQKTISISTPAVHDLEGNTAARVPLSLPGLAVARRAVPYLRFDDDAGTFTSWGTTKTTTSCKGSGTCVALGPFRASYCNTGSKGGIATRLPGSGTVTVNLRVTGKRVAEYGGGSPPPSDTVKLAIAKPGEAAQSVPTMLKGTVTGAEVDTGWTTLTASSSGATETGIALGIGGTGEAAGCYGYPIPEEWDLTVYVDSIEMKSTK